LKYFSKECWAFIRALWQSYREKWLREPVEARAARVRTNKARQYDDPVGYQGLSSAIMDEARWTRFWSWRRVAEDERAKTYEDRLEDRQRELKT
jgi:hypothetical protein